MTQTPFHSRAKTFFTESFPLHVQAFTNTAGVGMVHDHDYHEAVLVLSGKGTHITATTQDRFQKGSLFLVPSGCIHHYHVEETGFIMNILFLPTLTASIYPNWESACPSHPAKAFFRPGLKTPQSFFLSPEGFSTTRALCDRAAHECKHLGAPGSHLVLKGLFLELIGQITRHAKLLGTPKIKRSSRRNFLEPLLLHLQKTFREPWSLAELASIFKTNPSYLSRVFHERTGYTLPAYINALRIRECKHLLVNTEISVLDIALRSGFENLSLFNRSFKQAFGMTPRSFRK